jgi:hypothetical protein
VGFKLNFYLLCIYVGKSTVAYYNPTAVVVNAAVAGLVSGSQNFVPQSRLFGRIQSMGKKLWEPAKSY